LQRLQGEGEIEMKFLSFLAGVITTIVIIDVLGRRKGDESNVIFVERRIFIAPAVKEKCLPKGEL
jgi:hypothetical protein